MRCRHAPATLLLARWNHHKIARCFWLNDDRACAARCHDSFNFTNHATTGNTAFGLPKTRNARLASDQVFTLEHIASLQCVDFILPTVVVHLAGALGRVGISYLGQASGFALWGIATVAGRTFAFGIACGINAGGA